MSGLEGLMEAMERAGYGGRLEAGAPMSRYTSFGVGGPTDLLVVAQEVPELVAWVRLARAAEVPCLVLGSGTNVLVSDLGIRGMVIINECQRHNIDEDGLLQAESGCLFCELAQEAVDGGWAGLEWGVGIPGTLGGAIVGNAGAYGGYIGDVLLDVQVLHPDGDVEHLNRDELGYGYRTSALKREAPDGPRTVVLEARLQLVAGEPGELRERAGQVTEQRLARTPRGSCAGSTFLRTDQYPAGFLIEQAGLKGYRIGGAQVSERHANFIMNVGGASAADISSLIRHIQDKVWQDYGQRLVPEIQFIGEWPEGAPVATKQERA